MKKRALDLFDVSFREEGAAAALRYKHVVPAKAGASIRKATVLFWLRPRRSPG